ncbi:retrovirus-related pol polyprotein from transposon TNT 1-94, partial [Tanacetum coccineum]
MGGKKYFLSIVDDYSRRDQTGRTVKKLRTYNGLEFCNQEFEQLCIESEVVSTKTCARTPVQILIDQEDGDDEDAWDQETEQTPDLIDYQLV